VQAVSDGLRAADRGEVDLATGLLELAISLYRGDLLEDEPYAEWVMAERDRLRAMATDSLRALSRMALASARHGDAAKYLGRLTEFEPFDSDVQIDFLRVLLLQERRTEALRRYATFRARLAREFRAEPGFTLAELQAT
jgi:DNA-binding SARP family transcriptional activator